MGIGGLAAAFSGSHFWALLLVFMWGISLPSRCFSSQSLMDGESVMLTQKLEDMTEAEMLAEIAKLEDRFIEPMLL